MKLTRFLAVATMILAPTFVHAQGCSGREHKAETASACMDGTKWDAALEACLPVVTG